MSENDDSVDFLQAVPVKHNDFNRYLEAKAPEHPCSECGHTNWSTISNREEEVGEEPTLAIGYILTSPEKGFAVHTLFCKICGYTKFFSAEVVNRWVADNG